MKNILIYTFRTNLYRNDLMKYFPNLVIFGNLKEDLDSFKDKILREKPKFIVGFALSNPSCFEKLSINNFNNKLIDKNEKESFELFIPESNLFDISSSVTSSFCNWTMYRVSNFIWEHNLNSKLIFIHFKKDDFHKLIKFLETIK
jgi:hypothetical protein